MTSNLNQVIFKSALRLLRPLVRILMRNGISFGAFADLAKRVYIDVATEEFGIPGRKQTISRVAIITGLSRKEVLRVKRLPRPDDAGSEERYNRAARVISAWVRERRFSDGRGRPAALPLDGSGPTFGELVKRFGGDVPHRAVLDELARVGAVERLEDGRIRLLARAYVPSSGEVEKIGILGTDVSDLISTIDHNLRSEGTNALFQRKVCYDNLPEEALTMLRSLTHARAQEMLESFDRWMAEHDRDANPAAEGTGRKRAGIGVYYFESDMEEESRHEDHQ